MIILAGSMSPDLWTIDGQTWANHKPIVATGGERVELMLHNLSMMGIRCTCTAMRFRW